LSQEGILTISYPTVTTKETRASFPDESVAKHLTVVLPRLKTVFLVLSQSTCTLPSTLSIAATENGIIVGILEIL